MSTQIKLAFLTLTIVALGGAVPAAANPAWLTQPYSIQASWFQWDPDLLGTVDGSRGRDGLIGRNGLGQFRDFDSLSDLDTAKEPDGQMTSLTRSQFRPVAFYLGQEATELEIPYREISGVPQTPFTVGQSLFELDLNNWKDEEQVKYLEVVIEREHLLDPERMAINFSRLGVVGITGADVDTGAVSGSEISAVTEDLIVPGGGVLGEDLLARQTRTIRWELTPNPDYEVIKIGWTAAPILPPEIIGFPIRSGLLTNIDNIYVRTLSASRDIDPDGEFPTFVIPEPGTYAMLGSFLGLLAYKRRKVNSQELG